MYAVKVRSTKEHQHSKAGAGLPAGIHLHAWDTRSRSWGGPDELDFTLHGAGRLLQRLRESSRAWHGSLSHHSPGEVPVDFHVTVQDLGDSGLAMLDVGDGSGPIEFLAVVPQNRLAKIRQDYAFELVAFLKFLGGVDAGSELAIHDYIEHILRHADRSRSLIFSISARLIPVDIEIAISMNVERLSMCMLEWLAERDR